MKKNQMCFIVLLSIYQLAYTNINAQPFNSNLATMLQDTLNFYFSGINNIKGMTASVYLPGQGMWQGKAGVSFTGQPITQDMEFGVASNTKLFVATMMLKLVENNIIRLNDSLHRWLPAYPNVNPNITIKQLLSHKSGISDPIFLSPWMDTIMANPTRVFTPTEVLSWLGAPYFPKGISWEVVEPVVVAVSTFVEVAVPVIVKVKVVSTIAVTTTSSMIATLVRPVSAVPAVSTISTDPTAFGFVSLFAPAVPKVALVPIWNSIAFVAAADTPEPAVNVIIEPDLVYPQFPAPAAPATSVWSVPAILRSMSVKTTEPILKPAGKVIVKVPPLARTPGEPAGIVYAMV